MRTPPAAATACLLAALLIGCQKTPDASTSGVPDAGRPDAQQAVPGAQAGSATNTSVPPADAVMAPASAKPAEPAAAGRTNTTMSRAQESSAMPLPGQNNDHSAPLSTAKPAPRANGTPAASAP